jgi:hypothetical protein
MPAPPRLSRAVPATLPFTLLLTLASSALAREPRVLELFKDGAPVAAYDDLVADLVRGDTLVFSDGRRFQVRKVFPSPGAMTRVLDVGGGKVIRIPKISYMLHFQQLFLEQMKELEAHGVPAVRVFAEESLSPEYLVVEKVDIRFTAEDLLNRSKPIPRAERAKAKRALTAFARSTASLSEIGDFKPDALVWDGSRWRVLDTGLFPHVPAEAIASRTVFESEGMTLPPRKGRGSRTARGQAAQGRNRELPRKLQSELRTAVLRERRARKAKCTFPAGLVSAVAAGD